MKLLRVLSTALLLQTASACLARTGGFLSTLTADQKEKLGLSHLSPEQQQALDKAIEAYRSKSEAIAVTAAKEEAVAEYKKAEEPSVIKRALDIFRTKQEEERQERFTALILGEFRGWTGRTVFRLDNGQIWRQAASDTYVPKPQTDVQVAVYKSKSGYWRLRILDDVGAWVTVERLK